MTSVHEAIGDIGRIRNSFADRNSILRDTQYFGVRVKGRPDSVAKAGLTSQPDCSLQGSVSIDSSGA